MRSGSATEVPPNFWTINGTDRKATGGLVAHDTLIRSGLSVRLLAVSASRLDETYSVEVRSSLLRITVAKVAANSAFRFVAPFGATIASGLHVSLASVGGAIAVGEFAGLSAPL